ncbi:helix-turn-helix transcriptional regulator [Arthrobacter crystallopoietes]|uniref:helix-turn-helix transcriptional regulator n=1 Tax=Crystallibacter crystallopoietes TaxID=37928 RepID=UPI001FCA0A5F|nr:LuxR family transcriptional regulator [Arthrobacter crystallopoietes]
MEGFGSIGLVGRDRDLSIVLHAIRTTGGALLVANQGLGKSALARAVIAELGGEMTPLLVYASPSLACIPFGALAPYLSSLQVERKDSVLPAMRSVLAHIHRLSAGKAPVLMVIDDVHELDESSSLLAAQLVASGAVRLLAMSRTSQAPPPEIQSLATDGLILRHTLQPLDRAQAHELCRQMLHGEILPSISEALVQSSGGNPMFLLALLAQVRRDGTLVERNGVWLLGGEPLPPDLRLTDLIKGHFSRCTETERELLETVALVDPVPLQVLLQTGAGDQVDALVEARLITIGDDAEQLVRVAHPIYAQVLRAMVPAGRSLRIRRCMAAYLGRLASRPFRVETLLRSVDWSLDCGVPVPDQQLLQAAQVANSLFHSRFALRAAGAVRDPAYRPAAQMALARAHFHSGDYERAGEMLAGVLARTGDLGTAKQAALLAAQLHLHLHGGPTGLYDLADQWSRAVERIKGANPRLQASRAVVIAEQGYRLMRVHAKLSEGQLAEAEAELRELQAASDGFPETELVIKTLLGDVYAATGRLVSGAALTRGALALLQRNEEELLGYYEYVLTTHITACVRLAEWDEVRIELERYAGTGHRGLFYFGGAVSYAYAMREILQGRTASGLQMLNAAIEGLRQSDLEHLLPIALASGAYASAMAGLAALAGEYLAAYAAVPYASVPQLQLLSRGYVAAAGYLIQNDDGGLGKLRSLSRDARKRGLASTELDLRQLSLRLGDLTELDELVKAADLTEGTPAAQLTAFARALRDEDMDAVLRISRDPSAGHGLRLTLQSLQQRDLLPQHTGGAAGRQDFLQQVKRQLQKLSLVTDSAGGPQPGGAGGLLGGGLPAGGLFGGSSGSGPSAFGLPAAGAGWAMGGANGGQAGAATVPARLTRREREIGRLVVDGLANSDIAARLSLSVRTVEGHIYRMFAKLQISNREDLIAEHLD